jgi:dTDP-4-dehydrorhamnose 3,5-epimerase
LRLLPTGLPEVLLVEPRVHRDERGFFFEVFHAGRFAAQGLDVSFVQDNHSLSRRGTLRGLHLQVEDPQGKLVRVIEGAVFDVAVDVRVGSPSFGRWEGVTLSAENLLSLWIPPGFAHGFCVTSERAQVEYRCTALYRADAELAIRWDDPELAIEWPLAAPLLSPRDAAAPQLAAVRERLPRFPG